MERFRKTVNRTLYAYKRKSKNDYLVLLPIYDKGAQVVAFLRPITKDFRVTTPECVALLSKWRVENPSIATGTFEVTHERTEKWLDNLVIENDNRILFLIQAIDGSYLGHIGFAAFDDKKEGAEIDSVLRGVKDTSPGLMEWAMETIMQWGKDVLRLKEISLKVFSDNLHAIAFYKRCGFREDILIPLIKVVLPGEEKWEIATPEESAEAGRYYLQMIYEG